MTPEAPADVAAEAASRRGRLRVRRVVRNALANGLARSANIALMIVATPVVLRSIGPQGYGVWFTLTALSFLLTFADFGVGSGLVNDVSEADVRGDVTSARAAVASAWILLWAIAGTLIAMAASLNVFVDWSSLLGVSRSSPVQAQVSVACLVAIALVAVTLPMSTAQRVQMALQSSVVAGIAQAAASLTSLVWIAALGIFGGSLVSFVLAYALPPAGFATLNAAHVFWRWKPQLRPTLSLVSWQAVRRLSAAGSMFFALQMLTVASYQLDALVLARIAGARAVADYGVASRLFTIPTTIVTLAALPLWPAFREAATRTDVDWVRIAYSRALKWSVGLTIVVSAGLTVGARTILDVWVGPSVRPGGGLFVALALWTVASAAAAPAVMLLNALHQLRLQLVCVATAAVVNVTLSIWLTMEIGTAGVVWGSFIPITLFVVIPYLALAPRYLRRAEAIAGARPTDDQAEIVARTSIA